MFKLITSALLGVALLSTSARAATVTNRDAKDYKLTVLEGDKAQHLTLKPAGTLQDICPKGCIVRLNDSENDEYELEGTEIVSIEDGYLYYDVPDADPSQQPGAAAGAPPAGAPPAAPPGAAPASPPAGEPKKP